MRSRNKITPQSNVYFITSTVHCFVPIILNETCFQIILNSFKYCQAHKGLKIHAFVIMPNHFHQVISHENSSEIMGIIRDMKKFTSKEISTYLSSLGKFSTLFWLKIFFGKEHNQVWQEGYHPVALISEQLFYEKIAYIHENPVKKGFVEKPEHWKYSSARNYLLNDDSLISIDKL